MLDPHTSWRKGGQAKNTEKRQNITTTKTQCTQMPKSNRNGCKNGKQTYLLVQGTRSAVQKSQVTVDTKTLSKKQSMYHTSEWHKLPLSSKVCKSQTK